LESDAQRARRRSSVAATAAGDDDDDFRLVFRIGNADFDLVAWVRDFGLAGCVAG
jgi:hypothetical protein